VLFLAVMKAFFIITIIVLLEFIFIYLFIRLQDVLHYFSCRRGTVGEGAGCCSFRYHDHDHQIHSHHHHKRSIYYCMEVFQHQREIKEKSKEEIPTSWSHQHNTLQIIMIDFFL
jgi:hypothetical protein